MAPSFSTRPWVWDRVRRVLSAPWPAHRATFLHRDYHPGNVLWDGARVSGVVDWATAAWGPPGIDLARMRRNLAMHGSREAADRFAAAYVAAGGDPAAHAAYWDLLDAADMVLDVSSPAQRDADSLARLEAYVEGVLAES